MPGNILETVNIPRDTTIQSILGVQKGLLLSQGTKEAVLFSGDPDIIDRYYKGLVNQAASVSDVDSAFIDWWAANWKEGETTRNELLARWFGNVLEDDRVHGVKIPLFATSTSAICELTDDSVGLTCAPSTETTAGKDDFAYLPQFWCVEVSAEKNDDGSHTIYAVEHIDDIETVRNGDHLCWVLQKNTYTREWEDGGYHYFKMRCRKAAGYTQWPQGTDVNGTVYPYMANPKYYAGLKNGTITCGTGLAPVNYTSHTAAVNYWRARGVQYSGASGNLLKFQLAMIWLKYAKKGNSGTIEGCSSYSYQYTAAITETGVERIILTTTQAANLFEGSNIIIGNKGSGTSTDRGTASMYSICKNKRIKSIESVTIDEVEYAAVNIDNDGTTFDTVAGETYISTMPYYSGWNDNVQGFDGSKNSPTSGKEPGLIQKTEFQNGAYLIVSDELWQWGTNEDGDYTFDCYTCHTQSKVSGSTITADYEKQDDLTLVFPADTAAGWQYIEDIAVAEDKAVLWPKAVSTKAGSGTGAKAGFFVYPASSGVRAAWCVCDLGNGGAAGLPARYSNSGVSYSIWNGSPGAPGLAG